ncbi:flagellar assembly factor FliW [Lysinibacillus alkalisoli]|uniref:Flagellar assembly factor FliW n=1 Tax=Lysinibacillus alkalisoli TaxID=1911548 RepID=A0A917D528_9BACI|nr:flagellar assembly protein FliW [Lysinibacillus alkalisoli]GGG13220.1 flagellar assembly factor FliW [Lysinibacillus alkalisoli]
MKIETKFLGEVAFKEEDVYTFPQGLPGFSDLQRFILMPIDADLPLVALQSVDQPTISFIMAYPFAFDANYTFDLSDEDKQTLHIEGNHEVLPYAIITMKETLQTSTMNLLAPVVLNITKKMGKQIVLQDNKKYPLHFPLGKGVTK